MKIKNDKLAIQITCLIVSVILWMVIILETNPLQEETIANIPISVKNLNSIENSNLVLMNSDKDHFTVNVRVKGTINQITSANKSDFSAYIDVLGFSEGTTNAKVEVSCPSGLEVVSTHPSHISCNIERIISRVMDVTVQYEGKQADNYYRSLPSVNPSSVKITGPRSVVDSAAKAVATINVEKAKDNVVKTVPVRVYDGTDTEIFMSSPIENVEVTAPIYPTKYVNLIANVTGTPQNGCQLTNVTVNPSKVRIAARRDILDTVNELKLEDLDISGAYNNIVSSRKILDTDGLIILDMTADPIVNAVVEKNTEKEFVFKASDIQFTNLKEGSKAVALEPEKEISVVVTGSSSVVDQLNNSDLALTVDLSSVAPGQSNVKIQCTTDKSVNGIALSQGTIGVEITEAETQPETVEE